MDTPSVEAVLPRVLPWIGQQAYLFGVEYEQLAEVQIALKELFGIEGPSMDRPSDDDLAAVEQYVVDKVVAYARAHGHCEDAVVPLDYIFRRPDRHGDYSTDEWYHSDGRNFKGYDRDGYNADGFDRNGRDRDGRDRDGYDRDGYDRGGYGRYGFNREGYNRNGYDRSGYDRQGFDANGRSRSGEVRSTEDFLARLSRSEQNRALRFLQSQLETAQ